MTDAKHDTLNGNILIVDDTLPNLHLLSQMLTEQGYLVRGVPSGQMALTAVAAEPPQLILLDVNMPDMNGYEVCRRLKAASHSAGIPVIFISALGEVWDKLTAFSVGGVDYITKPFQLQEVLARVKTHLTLHNLRQQLEINNEQLQHEIDERKRTETELQKLNEKLEDRVAQRTEELVQANAKLQAEMDERQRTEAAMRQAQKLENLGVLSSGIAHDFNNLLTAMMTESSLALLKTPLQSPSRMHNEKVIRITERAASLTRQLLAYAGKERFERIPLDLNLILEDNLSLLNATIPKNIELHATLNPDSGFILADAGQIQQVIMNLIINAAEAYDGQAGTVHIQTRLAELHEDRGSGKNRKGALSAGQYICLSIIDKGKGMHEETLSNIFDPFFSTKTSGRGLGLSALQGIVQGHQGQIEVISQPGRGTTFHVWFPIIHHESEPAPAIEPAAHKNFGTILLVDDEVAIRTALAEILEISGFTVLSAPNGQEALTIFQEQVDELVLIVMDIGMPVMMGTEAVTQIRAINANVPIILLSGYGEQEIAVNMSQSENTQFLRKPFSLEKLMTKIAKAVRL